MAVPEGSGVRIDGRPGDEEWADSKSTPLAPGAELLVKRRAGDLLLAIRLPPGEYRYVDFYVRDSNGRLLNLHSSMKQGERQLGSGWTDSDPPFQWGPFQSWSTSIAERTGAPSPSSIVELIAPLQGYEVQVPLRHLGACPFRIRIEVRDFRGQAPEWVFPAGSTRLAESDWALLRCQP